MPLKRLKSLSDLAASLPVARSLKHVVVDPDLLERVGLKEFAVRLAELRALAAQPLEFADGFRFVNERGKVRTSIVDRVTLWHHA